MKRTALLPAAAICLAFACAKTEQKPSDTAAATAQNQTAAESTSVAGQTNPVPPTAESTATAPVAPAPAAPVAPPAAGKKKTGASSTGAQKAATTTTTREPSAGMKKTTAPAAAPPPPAPTKAEVKPAPAAAPAPAPAPTAAPAAAASAEGEALYNADCRRCHGARGVPPKAMQTRFPKIASFDSKFFATHSQDSIVTVLKNGKGQDMKSFKDKLTTEQMRAVAAYMRTFM